MGLFLYMWFSWTYALGPFNYYVTLSGGGGGWGGGGVGQVWHFVTREGRVSAERYVTPEIMYMYNIIL